MRAQWVSPLLCRHGKKGGGPCRREAPPDFAADSRRGLYELCKEAEDAGHAGVDPSSRALETLLRTSLILGDGIEAGETGEFGFELSASGRWSSTLAWCGQRESA